MLMRVAADTPSLDGQKKKKNRMGHLVDEVWQLEEKKRSLDLYNELNQDSSSDTVQG